METKHRYMIVLNSQLTSNQSSPNTDSLHSELCILPGKIRGLTRDNTRVCLS